MSEPFQATPAQMFFGAAHGHFSLPDWVEDMFVGILREWERVFWNINQQSWEDNRDAPHRIGTVFYRPYCWGDCNCGFEARWSEKDAAWCEQHKHAPTCYQTELHARMEAYDNGPSRYAEINRRAFGDDHSIMSGFDWEHDSPMPGVVTSVGSARKDDAMEAWRMADDARGEFESALYDELCTKHGVDREYGAAVHCTCDYERLRHEWCQTDDHAQDCQIVVPNFGIDGDPVEIRWYKYPGRGMSVNVQLTTDDWIAWRDRVTEALKFAEHERDVERYREDLHGTCMHSYSCKWCIERGVSSSQREKDSL